MSTLAETINVREEMTTKGAVTRVAMVAKRTALKVVTMKVLAEVPKSP